ncbi:hypothetical protein ABW19_dt0200718 [Dactylella cylindrospora]|nr:hypothetical protein ABW19_dt0200718 [Dactylella cylindrospora]
MSSGIPDTAQGVKSDATNAPVPQQQQSKKQEKKEKQQKQPQANGGKAAAAGAPAEGGEKKLSGKELKELKKAEKQARRAAEKLEKVATAGPSTPGPQSASLTAAGKQPPLSTSPADSAKGKQQQKSGMRGSRHAVLVLEDSAPSEPPLPKKVIPFFEHLKEDKPEVGLDKVNKDLHPAVMSLAIHLKDYSIMGSTARALHMMMAFKEVIKDYSTPRDVTMSRNLTQHLGIQISHLAYARKLSVSQGNAIRWLKSMIIDIKPDADENEAKNDLLEAMDSYMKERIIIPQEVISRLAAEKISDGDVILTYAKSSCVERCFREAQLQGKKFTVVCVDSRPWNEGANMAKSLSESGIPVKYTYIHGVANIIKKVDKCFFGAHSMFANGYLYSRCGTAAVAMMAHEAGKPVLVCSEAIKFTDKIILDSITSNELGPIDPLVDLGSRGDQPGPLANHLELPNLHLVNIMYDSTPAKYITAVITETGAISPMSVSAVHRMISEKEGTSEKSESGESGDSGGSKGSEGNGDGSGNGSGSGSGSGNGNTSGSGGSGSNGSKSKKKVKFSPVKEIITCPEWSGSETSLVDEGPTMCETILKTMKESAKDNKKKKKDKGREGSFLGKSIPEEGEDEG